MIHRKASQAARLTALQELVGTKLTASASLYYLQHLQPVRLHQIGVDSLALQLLLRVLLLLAARAAQLHRQVRKNTRRVNTLHLPWTDTRTALATL